MEYRTLDITLISAKDIKNASLIGKSDVYAVAYISGTATKQKLRTPVDKHGGSNPTWNFPIKFTVDEAAGLQNRLTLVIEIKAVGTFADKNLGELRVPIKELLEGVSGKADQLVSYQVRRSSGKVKGYLEFSYKFGEKFSGKAEEPVTAYPPGMAAGSSSTYTPPPPSSYYPQLQTGYGYQHQRQQQPGCWKSKLICAKERKTKNTWSEACNRSVVQLYTTTTLLNIKGRRRRTWWM